MNTLRSTIIKHEANLGARIFGHPEAQKRQFYCLSENIWVWREEASVVFYKVNPSSIHKSNDGFSYRLAGKEEARRLNKAARIYKNLVEARIYKPLLALR